jgi:hypothetical protein
MTLGKSSKYFLTPEISYICYFSTRLVLLYPSSVKHLLENRIMSVIFLGDQPHAF